MFYQPRHSTTASAFKLKAKFWCTLIALITTLSFIALIAITTTHHHANTQETADCSFCSVASNKTGGNLTALVLSIASFFVLFLTTAPTLRSAFYVRAKLSPPACGPPGQIS